MTITYYLDPLLNIHPIDIGLENKCDKIIHLSNGKTSKHTHTNTHTHHTHTKDIGIIQI